MVMDHNFRISYNGPTSEIIFDDQAVMAFPDPNPLNNLRVTQRFLNGNRADTVPFSRNFNFDARGQSSDGDSPEDYDFSDAVLKYINHILMEEDVEEKTCMFQESAALQAAEKSLYEALGEQYPASNDYRRGPNSVQSTENPDKKVLEKLKSSFDDTESLCLDWNSDSNSNWYDREYGSVSSVTQTTSYSSHCSSGNNGSVIDGPLDSPLSTLVVPDIFSDSEPAIQFKKGVEEASKFLPTGSNFVVGLSYDESVRHQKKEDSVDFLVKVEKKFDNDESHDVSRGRKKPYEEVAGLQEERSNKQSAIYTESTVSPDMFDKVLLCSGGKNESDLRKALDEVSKSTLHNGPSKGSNGGKGRGKKQGGKKNVVDMRTLLTLCAQAVAGNDRRAATEFLKQIRQHANQTGDGMQRLAYYFASGLEARMAGSGTQVGTPPTGFPTSAADMLKAYHIYVATCPFRKISNFFANKTIMHVSEKATSLHIIDFGIFYGFQWPCFLQRLSKRPGGPPKLRVTGIDLPCPGFRPAQRVEETGRRLASYARNFGVPFEFNAIAQKWETIKLEDLNIKTDEVLAVSCLFRFRNLLDETVIVNSPRNIVLNLIRKMNPAVFVLGIVNGAYNAPFFITRFREALFHYSSFFDMLEANIPREVHERMLLEKVVFGREAINVIACEASARIERPETYKQWQVRNLRAGFEQLPLDKEIIRLAKDRVKSSYHKDFVIDEDGQWMLQGWKGRIVYALSSWRPAC